MSDLVIYFSRSNNTKIVAETFNEEMGADLVEIKDTKSRGGPVGYIIGAFDAIWGKKTVIDYDRKDLTKYDTIFIGTPVWASKPAPAITEFIKENDFKNLNVITFCTMSSSGDKQTLDYMNNLIKSTGGNVKKSFSIAVKNNSIKELALDALKDI